MGKGMYLISIALMVLVSVARGCTKLKLGARASDINDAESDSDERKVYYSDVVLFGEPNGTVTGNYPYKDMDGVSTLRFHVLCTYKVKNGPPIPDLIYITGMGNKNGEIEGCPEAEVGDAKEVVMFLKRTSKDDVFEIEYAPNSGEYDSILDEVSVVCDLTMAKKFHEVCQDFTPVPEEEGCIRWDPNSIKKLIEEFLKQKPTPEPEPTEPEPKPENPDGPVVDIDTKGKGKNDQSGEGYITETEKENTGPVAEPTGDNGSSIVATSLLVTLITAFLTIVV